MADYSQEWSELRLWRRIGFAIIGGYLVTMTYVLVAMDGKPHQGRTGLAVFGGFALGFVLASYKVGDFKCPRCRKQFLPPFWRRRDVITRRADCVHCGLHENSNG
jgi:hypothetical protein